MCFPFARSVIVLRCRRFIKKSGKTSDETRYYLSSELSQNRKPSQWDELVRGHWGGVEIRNHWRRDAIMREDWSRTRNVSQLANLALLRNAVIAILAREYPDENYVEVLENLQAKSDKCFDLAMRAF